MVSSRLIGNKTSRDHSSLLVTTAKKAVNPSAGRLDGEGEEQFYHSHEVQTVPREAGGD